VGVVVGLPALRVKGIYLGIATLSFGFIVEEVLCALGKRDRRQRRQDVGQIKMFGWKADTGASFYFVCLVVTVLPRWRC
jgi:branched-chain amino acid transport system permease protein